MDFVKQTKVFDTVPVDNMLPVALDANNDRCFFNCRNKELISKSFSNVSEAPGFKASCKISGNINNIVIYREKYGATRIVEYRNNVPVKETVTTDVFHFWSRKRINSKDWSNWNSSIDYVSLIADWKLDLLLYSLYDSKKNVQNLNIKPIYNDGYALIGKDISFDTSIDKNLYHINMKVDPQLLITSLNIQLKDKNISCSLSNFNDTFGNVIPKYYVGNVDTVFAALTPQSAIENILYTSKPSFIKTGSYRANIVLKTQKERYLSTLWRYTPAEFNSAERPYSLEKRIYDDGYWEQIATIGHIRYTRRSENMGKKWTKWEKTRIDNINVYSLDNIVQPSLTNRNNWIIKEKSIENGSSDLTRVLKLKLIDRNDTKHYLTLKIGFNQYYEVYSIYVEEYFEGKTKEPNIKKITFYQVGSEVTKKVWNDFAIESLPTNDYFTHSVDVIADIPENNDDQFVEFKNCESLKPYCETFEIEKSSIKSTILYGNGYKLYYNNVNPVNWEEGSRVFTINYIKGSFKLEDLNSNLTDLGFSKSKDVVVKVFKPAPKEYILLESCVLANLNSENKKECEYYRIPIKVLKDKSKEIILNENYSLLFNDVKQVKIDEYGSVNDVVGDFDIIPNGWLEHDKYKFAFMLKRAHEYDDLANGYLAFKRCDMLSECVIYDLPKEIVQAKGVDLTGDYRYGIWFNEVTPIRNSKNIIIYKVKGGVDIKQFEL